MRKRLASAMRTLADRIDHAGAPKLFGLSFTFEPNQGLVINDKGVGCQLGYLGDDEYAKAHDEAGRLTSRQFAWVSRRSST